MENERKISEKEMNAFVLVTNELLEQQSANNQLVKDLSTNVEQLKECLSQVAKNVESEPRKQSEQKPVLLNEILKNDMADIKSKLSNVQELLASKKVSRSLQILLFPPQDAKLFYRIVFGRWLLLLAIMLFINKGYKYAVHYNDNQRILKEKQLETERFTKAWRYLYLQQDRKGKRMMDSVFRKAER